MTMNPKEWWVATIVGIALSLAASSTVFADWSSVMDFFKSKSSEVTEGDGLSKAAEAAGLSQDQIAEGLKEALEKCGYEVADVHCRTVQQDNDRPPDQPPSVGVDFRV